MVTRLRTEFMVEGCVTSIESARIETELSCTKVLQVKGRSEQATRITSVKHNLFIDVFD